MNKDQKVAYTILLDTAERLRAVVVNARSPSQSLTLTDETVNHLRRAVTELHAAQRLMEGAK